VLPLEEAERIQRAFFQRYYRLRAWQRENAERAQCSGLLRSPRGRPLRAIWEPGSRLKWTTCCNFPVQAGAADLALDAMARVHAALASMDAVLIMQVHDELVVETAETLAAEVAELLEEHMTATWRDLFPDAPYQGVVKVSTRKCWMKPEKENSK
jgi:DNA polymerase I